MPGDGALDLQNGLPAQDVASVLGRRYRRGRGRQHGRRIYRGDEARRTVGPVTVVSFPDLDAFDDWLDNVPYTKNGVWEKVEVYPYRLAIARVP